MINDTRKMTVRLATTTALVTTLCAFYNLPAQANGPELGVEVEVNRSGSAFTKDSESPTSEKKAPFAKIFDMMTIAQALDTSRHVNARQQQVVGDQNTSPTFKPLVEIIDGRQTPTTAVTENFQLFKDMNEIAYGLIGGYGEHNKRAVDLLEKLENKRVVGEVDEVLTDGTTRKRKIYDRDWEYKPFSGLEGVNSDFQTNSGVVFFNKKLNRIIVVAAGTSNNNEGWESNGKSSKVDLNPAKMQDNFQNDLFTELQKLIDDALDPQSHALSESGSLSQEVMNIMHLKIGVGTNILDEGSLRKAAKAVNEIAIHKPNYNQESLVAAAANWLMLNMPKPFKEHKDNEAVRGLTKEQVNILAQEIAKESIIKRDLIKASKDKKYTQALEELKAEIEKYQSAFEDDTKVDFKEQFKDFFKSNPSAKKNLKAKVAGLFKRKKILNENSDEIAKAEVSNDKYAEGKLVAYGEQNHSLARVLLAFGKLRVMMQDGKLDANQNFATVLWNKFDTKLQLMATVAIMEDKAKKTGQKFLGKGQVHLGAAQESLSSLGEVVAAFKKFDVNSDTEVFFTGHSKGGNKADQLAALYTANFATDFHGKPGEVFDNKKSNNVKVYTFEGARAGNNVFAKHYDNELIGKENKVRHNIIESPVPNALPGSALEMWIKNNFPVAYGLMAANMGYADTGYLAAQSGNETWGIAKAIYKEDGFDVSEFDKLDTFINCLAGLKLGKGNVPSAAVDPKVQESMSWVRKAYNVTATGIEFAKIITGNEELSAHMAELFVKRYAHMHMGYDEGVVNGTHMGAHFNQRLIMDPAKAFAIGWEHQHKPVEVK
jgi:hypothetical protein